MKVTLGSNDFFGVPFPLVLADRFFHIYTEEGELKLDIFRWDEENKQPVYEVIAGNPKGENIATNPTGVITFSHPETGTFLYKFRPKPGISQIFGKVPVDEDFQVRINDHAISVTRGALEGGNSFTKNQISGFPIGMQVNADGSIGFGVGKLPEGMVLERRTT